MTSDRSGAGVEVSRGVATLTLDSPANRNALSRAMRAQLREALDRRRWPTTPCGWSCSTTPAGCSAPAWTSSEAAGGGAQDQGVREFPELLESIWSSPKPVRRRRPRAGPGRRRRAAGRLRRRRRRRESATFAFSEVRLGVVPAVISAVVPAADGAARRAPADAHRPGLRRRDRGGRRAGRPGRRPTPTSTASVRAQLVAADRGRPDRPGRDQAAAARRDADLRLRRRCSSCPPGSSPSEEGQEGIASFREKRPARWVPTAERSQARSWLMWPSSDVRVALDSGDLAQPLNHSRSASGQGSAVSIEPALQSSEDLASCRRTWAVDERRVASASVHGSSVAAGPCSHERAGPTASATGDCPTRCRRRSCWSRVDDGSRGSRAAAAPRRRDGCSRRRWRADRSAQPAGVVRQPHGDAPGVEPLHQRDGDPAAGPPRLPRLAERERLRERRPAGPGPRPRRPGAR